MTDQYVTISLTVEDDEEPFTQRLAFDVTVQRGEARFAVNTLAVAVYAALQAHPGFAGAGKIAPKCGHKVTWDQRPEGDNISRCERQPHPSHEAHEGRTQKGTLMTWSGQRA